MSALAWREAWRAWWSPEWMRERGRVPLWRQLVLTFGFNTSIALVLTLVAWGFSNRVDLGKTWQWNFVIAQCVGFSIHGLFSLALAVFGGSRIEGLNKFSRLVFYAGIPILGVFIGYSLGLSLLGVDVARLVTQSPQVPIAILLLSLILSAFWYRSFANRARLAELEAERSRAEARVLAAQKSALDAQLRSLQAQIEPHFLFNTLANVVSLIDTQPERARSMLERLIELLRASLAASRAPRSRLSEELALVSAYLEILGLRMGARLKSELAIEARARTANIPPLLLQPLVENAIRHGLEPKLEGGKVSVSAFVQEGRLIIEVSDDGLGFAPGPDAGIGLANLRERLLALHGEAASLRIEDAAPGTRVRIELPFEAEECLAP